MKVTILASQPTPVLVVVPAVSRFTGEACWGRKDFFITFLLEFWLFFAAGERHFSPHSSLSGSGEAFRLSPALLLIRLTLHQKLSSLFRNVFSHFIIEFFAGLLPGLKLNPVSKAPKK